MKIRMLSYHRLLSCCAFAAVTLLLTGSLAPESRMQSVPTAAGKGAALLAESMQNTLPEALSERESMWLIRSFRNR